MPELEPIPVICGPTGSGKTSVAVGLAASFPIEVISADSRQIIRHLNIGTAKPTPAEQEAVRFHLIDIVEPGDRYSAYQFIEDCDRAVESILERGHIPVVVGGTGLYLRALTEGVIEVDDSDSTVRERLETEMDREGPEAMYARLTEVDPEEGARTHANNRVRVIRALEIFELTGRPKSELTCSGAYKRSRYEYSLHCLQQDRESLYDRINRRVDQMLADGLVGEVEKLVADGLRGRLREARVIGYDEILDYLDGRASLDEAVESIKQNSRRYAKRQITWFRHQAECEYYDNPARMSRFLLIELERFRESV